MEVTSADRGRTPTRRKTSTNPPSAIEVVEAVIDDLHWMLYKDDLSRGVVESAENRLKEALELLRNTEDDFR